MLVANMLATQIEELDRYFIRFCTIFYCPLRGRYTEIYHDTYLIKQDRLTRPKQSFLLYILTTQQASPKSPYMRCLRLMCTALMFV